MSDKRQTGVLKGRLGHLPRPVVLLLLSLPLVMWLGYWLLGDPGLISTGLVFVCILLGLNILAPPASAPALRDDVTGLEFRPGFLRRLEALLAQCANRPGGTAVFVFEISDHEALLKRFGPAPCDQIFETLADRVLICMRAGDAVGRIGDNRLAIALHPVAHMDVELALQIAARVQSALEEQIALVDATVNVSVSVGFGILERGRQDTAERLLDAATTALAEARRAGPSSIRAFSDEMKQVEMARRILIDEAGPAFETGQIRAWFQPQISTDTGKVSGLEALARWIHPTRGLIPPAEFLPALEQAGMLRQLNETILAQALAVLHRLDQLHLAVPVMSVNFAPEDLRDTQLIDRIRWELDRNELAPERLGVELLETVVSGEPGESTMQNIDALHALGCSIDIDDFGTGHASITSLRRFPVSRLKIDRSFVSRCDRDIEQQQMLMTILTMAEQLNLETIAEGLETAGEHAMLSQLGVGHVQGFGIARPMPEERLADWMRDHDARLAAPPPIGGTAL